MTLTLLVGTAMATPVASKRSPSAGSLVSGKREYPNRNRTMLLRCLLIKPKASWLVWQSLVSSQRSRRQAASVHGGRQKSTRKATAGVGLNIAASLDVVEDAVRQDPDSDIFHASAGLMRECAEANHRAAEIGCDHRIARPVQRAAESLIAHGRVPALDAPAAIVRMHGRQHHPLAAGALQALPRPAFERHLDRVRKRSSVAHRKPVSGRKPYPGQKGAGLAVHRLQGFRWSPYHGEGDSPAQPYRGEQQKALPGGDDDANWDWGHFLRRFLTPARALVFVLSNARPGRPPVP